MENTPKNNLKNDYIYKTVGENETALTFLPPTKDVYEKAPVYFIIPGGGWHSCDRNGMIWFSQYSVDKLREKGFAVVSIDYRTTKMGAKINNIIEDCFSALKFVCDNADVLKVDTKKIVISGHSAGAHLALMVAYAKSTDFGVDCGDYNIIATVPLSPATILHTDGYPETIKFNFNHIFDNTEDLAVRKKASPIEYVTKLCPPTMLVAGTADNLIDYNSCVILNEKLQSNGVKTKLLLSENGGHCYEKVNDKEPSVDMANVQKQITEFILECI